MTGMKLLLPEASKMAREVDIAFFVVLGISLVIFLILFVLLVVFAARYRRGTAVPRGPLPRVLQHEIEIGWTAGTIFLAIFIFWWFVSGIPLSPRYAPNQLEIHVVAKQWMWKTQHPDGAREINALHIPVGQQVRLVMTSQDVIHSFFVPAFRLKQDVLPGRDTELVFTPTEIGSFHLFCAEYCGTQHSHMTGQVVVMTPQDYSAWLRAQPHGDTLVREGEALYAKFGCGACHSAQSQVRAPKLAGLYGNTVVLAGGSRATANDAYLRKSIVQPRDDIVAGYPAIMPSYASLANPSDIDALVAYIKSQSVRRGAR
jgi:cytochrome c oxidase subunit II